MSPSPDILGEEATMCSPRLASLALVARSPPTPPEDEDLAFVHFIWEVPQKFEIRVLTLLVMKYK